MLRIIRVKGKNAVFPDARSFIQTYPGTPIGLPIVLPNRSRGYDQMTGKRSWVEIDLRQLRLNYEIYKSLQPEGREIMAVVKADAYGHGDAEVSAELSSLGVDRFAVSNVDEALHVRRVTDGEILILGYTPTDRAGELVENRITQALLSEKYAEKLLSTGLPSLIALLSRRMAIHRRTISSSAEKIPFSFKRCKDCTSLECSLLFGAD